MILVIISSTLNECLLTKITIFKYSVLYSKHMDDLGFWYEDNK